MTAGVEDTASRSSSTCTVGATSVAIVCAGRSVSTPFAEIFSHAGLIHGSRPDQRLA